MDRLPEDIQGRVRSLISKASVPASARPFIEAVIAQRSLHHGAASGELEVAAVEQVAAHVLRLVERSTAGEASRSAAATELAEDHALLAAFFQNLDLLPADHDPYIDPLALMVGDAVHRLSETLDPGPDAV